MIEPNEGWIVIPAFNEASMVGDVVRRVREWYGNVVVVDDCSRDNTSQQARDAGAEVVRHVVNLGQGAAIQTGIDFALRHGARAVVTFDADGQHSASDVQNMIEVQRETGADVVLGSRFSGNTVGISSARRLLLKAAIVFTWLTSGIRLSDAHNGLRLLTSHAARRIRITQNRMAHASEIIDQIGRIGLNFAEAPCTVTYTDYSMRKGQSCLGALRILVDLIMARAAK